VRVGMVSPYSFDIPGGVQNHVRDLAEWLVLLVHPNPMGADRALPSSRSTSEAHGRGQDGSHATVPPSTLRAALARVSRPGRQCFDGAVGHHWGYTHGPVGNPFRDDRQRDAGNAIKCSGYHAGEASG